MGDTFTLFAGMALAVAVRPLLVSLCCQADVYRCRAFWATTRRCCCCLLENSPTYQLTTHLRQGDDALSHHGVVHDVALERRRQRLGRGLQGERKHLEQDGRLQGGSVVKRNVAVGVPRQVERAQARAW